MTDMLIVLLNGILQLLRKVKHSIRRDLRKMLVEYLRVIVTKSQRNRGHGRKIDFGHTLPV